MSRFIDDHREKYGVESICRVLPIARLTYYEQKARTANPSHVPLRAHRDEFFCEEIQRVWEENRKVCGARKVWLQLKRKSFVVARCTVARLMREMGLRGVVRGKKSSITTVAGANDERPMDLVNREFVATRPNRLHFDWKWPPR